MSNCLRLIHGKIDVKPTIIHLPDASALRKGLCFDKMTAERICFLSAARRSIFYAQNIPPGFGALMTESLRNLTAFSSPSSLVIKLSSCSMLSTSS